MLQFIHTTCVFLSSPSAFDGVSCDDDFSPLHPSVSVDGSGRRTSARCGCCLHCGPLLLLAACNTRNGDPCGCNGSSGDWAYCGRCAVDVIGVAFPLGDCGDVECVQTGLPSSWAEYALRTAPLLFRFWPLVKHHFR